MSGRGETVSGAALIYLAVAVVLLSSAWPVTKNAITQGASPMWFAVGRAGFSALSAFVLLAALRRLRLPRMRDMPAMLAVGVLQIAGFFGFAHAGAEFVPAGRTAVLANVTTLWIVPLSILVLHERIPPKRLLAAALSMAGVVVLTGPWAIDWADPHVVLGYILLQGAALCWSAAIVIVRRYPPRATMLEVLPWSFAVATIILAPIAALTQDGVGQWGMPAIAGMAYIGLFAGPTATWCIMEVTTRLPSMVSSIGFLASPVLGLLLSAWWLGEALTLDLLIGGGFILTGALAAAWPKRSTAALPLRGTAP